MRLRRMPASPKALGLVSFSLVGLCLGSAVYVAAIPGLFAQSPVVSTVQEAGEQVAHNAADTFDNASRAVVAGLEVASVSSAGTPEVRKADPPTTASSASSSEGAQQPSNTKSDTSSNSTVSDNPDSANPEPDPAPKPDAGQGADAKWRDYYVATFNNLTSMVESYNSCVSDLNVKRYASYGQRSAALSKCEALSEELFDGYRKVVNSGIPEESKYYRFKDPQIICHRALAGALDSIISAWEINLTFSDEDGGPYGHEDEFMKPLLDDQVNGENRCITEFKQYYASGCPSDD